MTIDLSGEWIFDGHPFDAPYAGQIRLTLKQSGTSISGDLLQLQDPFSGKPPADPEATRAEVAGELIEGLGVSGCAWGNSIFCLR